MADLRNRSDFPRQEKAMLHCNFRVRWTVASDLRIRAAISESKTSSFYGISGDLALSTRKSLAIAIVRFWCAKTPIVMSWRFAAKTLRTPFGTARVVGGGRGYGFFEQLIVPAPQKYYKHCFFYLGGGGNAFRFIT